MTSGHVPPHPLHRRGLLAIRYYLLCTGLALTFWDTALIKPFRFFVVLVHEVNHAAAALITGGEVLEIRTHWNESGHTLTKGDSSR